MGHLIVKVHIRFYELVEFIFECQTRFCTYICFGFGCALSICFGCVGCRLLFYRFCETCKTLERGIDAVRDADIGCCCCCRCCCVVVVAVVYAVAVLVVDVSVVVLSSLFLLLRNGVFFVFSEVIC